MIRAFEQHDMERVLEVWLSASIKAHDFIDAAYWQSHAATMRDVYIPASETYVLEDQSGVQGFAPCWAINWPRCLLTRSIKAKVWASSCLSTRKTFVAS